jgi:hexosaminidase
MTKNVFFSSVFIIILSSCVPTAEKGRPAGDQLTVTWEHLGNRIDGQSKFGARFIIKNNSDKALPAGGWAIYFSQLTGAPIPESLPETARIEHISGDFYRLFPTESFQGLPPGESVSIDYQGGGAYIKEATGPCGAYIVFLDEDGSEQEPELLTDFRLTPLAGPDQTSRGPGDLVPHPTPEWVYGQNQRISSLDLLEVPRIIPTPVRTTPGNGSVSISSKWSVHFAEGLDAEAVYLSEQLGKALAGKITTQKSTEADPQAILLELKETQVGGKTKEAYQFEISPATGVRITGSDAAAVFYGIQSLLAWLPEETWGKPSGEIKLDAVTIQDAPRFGYRGLHLDVSRNFSRKESVLKLLDLMAAYKLNRFHFHLTDDEGWRLEIPELPELTEVGAFRGHTVTDGNYLHPSYGSGPFPDPAVSHGSGYYTREDFIEILSHAKARHIEVIPEFDMPGHARAAIKAMASRYRRLAAEGQEEAGRTYLLNDLEDESKYLSIQNYNDNVVCPCQESTYQFLEKVVQRVKEMYETAGAPLTTIHIGGDEVPGGVWEESPACVKFKIDHPTVKTADDLFRYFIERFHGILEKYELATAGWEEIAVQKVNGPSGADHLPNPKFAGKNFIPYVWTEYWGNHALGNRLANAGYPVVLCNVHNLYFDLAYNKDPKEPGLYWGGFVDEFQAFRFTPEDIFKSTPVDSWGNKLDTDKHRAEMEGLSPRGRANILGIQGQLWSETIKGQDMLEYYALPKLLSLAERAWAPLPSWATVDIDEAREAALQKAWNVFANTVGQREFPRLDHRFDGFGYRIPPPGAVIEQGLLKANSAYPGLEIRYTADGSEPTASSPLYEGPVEVKGKVKLKAFAKNGRGSRVVEIE